MPDAAALDQATALIEKAWGRPIDALESLAVRRPGDDPLLRAALVITDTAIAVRQDRLHALTQPGHVPAFYEEDQITGAAVDLRIAQNGEPCVSAGDQARDRGP
ncbi:hypothetical protein ABT112_21385 [Streptomyces sp. NPDC002055]|uniref:hypothetical protein n=1 Tax=Streptomyces sp. NPDC002055 TaxID=3154534 RepID=UPI00332E76BA